MKKYTEEQWQELFARHDTSGVSAAEYCQQNDLCPKYFSVRRKQLAKAVPHIFSVGRASDLMSHMGHFYFNWNY